MSLGRVTRAGLATIVAVLACAAPAGAVSITQFPANPGKSSLPEQIISGPGGNLFWTQRGVEPGIGRMSPTGEHLPVLIDGNVPVDLVAAPSGYVSWVSEGGYGVKPPGSVQSVYTKNLIGGAIGLTAGGEVRFGGGNAVVAWDICTPLVPSSDHVESEDDCISSNKGGAIKGLAAAPSNTLWASEPTADEVMIFTAKELGLKQRVELPPGSEPQGVAVGPEGDAWIAMQGASAIDRIAPDGTRTRFALPPGSRPFDLVLGPDGAFWVTAAGTGKIVRMTTAGLVTNEYPVPSGETGQTGITVGPDGNIWFSDTEMGLVDRLVPDPLPVGGGGGGNPPVSDNVAPRFTAAPAFSPARFRVVGRARTKRSGGAPSGSSLKFSLSEAASVNVAVSFKARGRRVGGNCVAPGKAKRGARKCTRLVPRGTLALSGQTGANKVAFSGKVGGKPLSPGGYQATLTARDLAGNNSVPAAASFSIVR